MRFSAADGEIEMPVTTIDECLGEQPVTYIKMNIEGAEIDALHGGRRYDREMATETCDIRCIIAPAICGVFRAWCDEFNPKYELYLRQHDGGIIETVLYAHCIVSRTIRYRIERWRK